jgi:hypothetical protein
MVVIAAGGEEQRAGVAPHGAVEAERRGVEARRQVEVADVEMQVPDPRRRRHAAPRLVARRVEEPAQIERVRRHHQLAAHPPPAARRPVGVHLDAQAVRVPQIQRLAHQVIAGAELEPQGARVRQEASERPAVREQQREVVETRAAVGGRRARTPALAELHQRRPSRGPLGGRSARRAASQERPARLPIEEPHPEDLVVEGEGALEIADLQTHRPQPRRRRQAEPIRRQAVAPRRRRLPRRALAENVGGPDS